MLCLRLVAILFPALVAGCVMEGLENPLRDGRKDAFPEIALLGLLEGNQVGPAEAGLQLTAAVSDRVVSTGLSLPRSSIFMIRSNRPARFTLAEEERECDGIPDAEEGVTRDFEIHAASLREGVNSFAACVADLAGNTTRMNLPSILRQERSEFKRLEDAPQGLTLAERIGSGPDGTLLVLPEGTQWTTDPAALTTAGFSDPFAEHFAHRFSRILSAAYISDERIEIRGQKLGDYIAARYGGYSVTFAGPSQGGMIAAHMAKRILERGADPYRMMMILYVTPNRGVQISGGQWCIQLAGWNCTEDSLTQMLADSPFLIYHNNVLADLLASGVKIFSVANAMPGMDGDGLVSRKSALAIQEDGRPYTTLAMTGRAVLAGPHSPSDLADWLRVADSVVDNNEFPVPLDDSLPRTYDADQGSWIAPIDGPSLGLGTLDDGSIGLSIAYATPDQVLALRVRSIGIDSRGAANLTGAVHLKSGSATYNARLDGDYAWLETGHFARPPGFTGYPLYAHADSDQEVTQVSSGLGTMRMYMNDVKIAYKKQDTFRTDMDIAGHLRNSWRECFFFFCWDVIQAIDLYSQLSIIYTNGDPVLGSNFQVWGFGRFYDDLDGSGMFTLKSETNATKTYQASYAGKIGIPFLTADVSARFDLVLPKLDSSGKPLGQGTLVVDSGCDRINIAFFTIGCD